MLFSCCLEKKETCSSEEDCEGESGSDMEDKGAENEKYKKNASENESSIFFTENDRKGDDVVLLVSLDILEVFEWECDGISQEEK